MQLQKADEITEEESLQLQRKIHSVELLSPAGDWERLISAVSFGADAVYLGGSSYGLPTFFTSNNTIKELEEHLIGNDSEGKVKSRRIIERIKYLTDEIIMVAENRRK